MSEPMTTAERAAEWVNTVGRAIVEAGAPLIAALQEQIDSCEMGDRCKVCNQARTAIQEFHKKYPQLQKP